MSLTLLHVLRRLWQMLNLRDPEQTTFIISIIAGIIGGFVAGYDGTIIAGLSVYIFLRVMQRGM